MALILNNKSPTIVFGNIIAPSKADLVLSGKQPTPVLQGRIIAPGKADLVLSGKQPDPQEGKTLSFDIATSSDDTEEQSSGNVLLTSSNLNLGPSQTRYIGLRFTNVNIPNGATITEAVLVMEASATNSGSMTATIYAEDVDDAAQSDGSSNDISDRTSTTATVSWSIPNQTSSVDQQSVDISSVIQEVTDRSGWVEGNAVHVIITEDGSSSNEREWDSVDGGSAPELRLSHLCVDSPIITPKTADLTLTGNQPSLSESTNIDPSSADLTLTGKQPSIIQDHIADTGNADLTLTGNQPSLQSIRVIEPSKADLVVTGKETSKLTRSPAKADLSLSGFAPVLFNTVNTIPSKAALTLDGKSPTILVEQSVQPGKADLVLTGKSPLAGLALVAGKADLTLTAKQPTIVAGNVCITGKADFVLTAGTPTKLPEDQLNIQPGRASLVLAGKQPNPFIRNPTGKADLVLTGKQPTIENDKPNSIGKADLLLTGKTPTVKNQNEYIPNAWKPSFVNDPSSGTLTRSGAFDSISDTKVGTVSFWTFVPVDAGSDVETLAISDNLQVQIGPWVASDNKYAFSVLAEDDSENTVLSWKSNPGTGTEGVIPACEWVHVIASWDVENSSMSVYINDVEAVDSVPSFTDADIDYTIGTITIVAGFAGLAAGDYCLSELYFNSDEFIDLDVEANRRKFIDENLKPVSLGESGENPTGTQPVLYLKNPAGTEEENFGYGGDLTRTDGGFEECSHTPSGAFIPLADPAALVLDGKTPFQFITKSIVTNTAQLVLAGKTTSKLTRTSSKAEFVLDGKQPDLNPFQISKAELVITGKQTTKLTRTAGKATLSLTNKQPVSSIHICPGKADLVLDAKLPQVIVDHIVCPEKQDFVLTGKQPFVKLWKPQAEVSKTWTAQTEGSKTWTAQTQTTCNWTEMQLGEP